MSTNGRKPYEQKRKQKKPKRDARKKTKTKCKWIYLFQPTKICESMGNPRIREEAMEEKKEDYTDGVATNGQRVVPRLESKRKQKMKS